MSYTAHTDGRATQNYPPRAYVLNGSPLIRGDPFITFTPWGGEGMKDMAKFGNDSNDRLRETANKGGGGPKSQKFCERKKWMPPYSSSSP